MKRAVDGVGKLVIGSHGKEHVRGLHRNLKIMKIIVLKDTRMLERRFNQRLGAGLGIFLQKMPLQRSGIHPDPHRTAMVARRADDFAHPVRIADIAGVDPQAGGAGLGGLDGAAIMEMDVGDDRHRTINADLAKRPRAVLVGAGHPNDIRAGLGRGIDLRQRAANIRGQRIGHCLNGNRRVAADRHRTDHDLTASTSFDCPVGSVGVGQGRFSSVIPAKGGLYPAGPAPPAGPRHPVTPAVMGLELVAKTVGIKRQVTQDLTALANALDAAIMEQQLETAGVAGAQIQLVA